MNQNLIKRYLLFLFFFNIITFVFSYEKLYFWDKENFLSKKLTFDGNSFLADNKEIEKKDISYISFNLKDQYEDLLCKDTVDISVDELLNRAKYLEHKYGDSPMLILNDNGIQKLNKDGTRYSHYRYSIKIMNEKELDSAQLTFYYVKGSYDTKILMARSISPEGEVSCLQDKDIEYTSRKVEDISCFSGRRDEQIMKAIIPNVKVGSIIDYEYEIIEASPEDPNQFFPSWFFGEDKPVYESSIKFIIPENKEFYWVAKNVSKWKNNPKVEIEDGYKNYYFEIGEIPPIITEPYSRPKREFYPSIFGSLFKDQTYLSDWLSRFVKERLVSDDKMKEAVHAVLEKENAKTEVEKLSAIYRFMQEYIHYRSIKTSLSSGFSGHPATETFENKYGDCIDKSILFSTLLGIANIEAYPVIVKTNDNPKAMFDEIGVISGNHAINEIHLKEGEKKIIYLDSTSNTYRYPAFRKDDSGIYAWNPILNTVRKINYLDLIWNTQISRKEINVLNNGSGTIRNSSIYAGDTEANVREFFLSLKEQEIKTIIGSLIARDFPGSTLIDYKYRDPNDYKDNMTLEYAYNAENIIKKSNDIYLFELPVKYNFDYISLNERKYPLFFQSTEGTKNSITINILENYDLIGLPAPLNIKNKYFSYNASYKIIGNKIVMEDDFQLTASNIPVEDYKYFKNDIMKVDHFIKNPLIFKKK